MADFTIKLANRIIDISSLHQDVELMCRDYLVRGDEAEENPGTPDIAVRTTQADIDFERVKSAEAEAAEGLPHVEYSDGYLETLAVYRQIADGMLGFGTLLFHGSALAIDGEAYIFAAMSGTGKSTHRCLWQEVYGERVTVVNDDKPLIRVEGDAVTVCGTPWDGKHRRSTNTELPLRAICILERGETNEIEPITIAEALPSLLIQSYRPDEPALMLKTLGILDGIVKNVKLYRLKCNMDPSAARVAYEGMQRNEGTR